MNVIIEAFVVIYYFILQYGSASGAVCKHIRRWVQRFTAKELEFYAIHFPKEPWKKLADICHFHPQKVGFLCTNCNTCTVLDHEVKLV